LPKRNTFFDRMNMSPSQKTLFTISGAEPTLLLGGPTACLLLHGFSSSPDEMCFLAEDLHQRGYTVLNVRLAGHGTDPGDLARTHWADWLLSVEEGLDLLKGVSDQVILIGQSMGGMIALTAAAQVQAAGVVALSTPYFGFSFAQVLLARILGALGLMARQQAKVPPSDADQRIGNEPSGYSRYPIRIIVEIQKLQKAMQASLPKVLIPVLLVQARIDMGGKNDLEQILTRLGSTRKETLWLDNFEHTVVRDEKRQVVFNAIGEFLKSLEKQE
jgi:carboxylesterase